jgi:hypothetical protein
VVARPGSWAVGGNLNTDDRRPISTGVHSEVWRSDDGTTGHVLDLTIRIRPGSNLALAFSPGVFRGRSALQYVQTVKDPTALAFFGSRYVFAELLQRNLSLGTRAALTISPSLTFELFVQPLISSVDYRRFTELAAPRTATELVYGSDVGSITPARGGSGQVTGYAIDPDGSGRAAPFTVENPDFNFRSLRGNAILRWEYRPGSTLYLVWTRTASDVAPFVGDLDFPRDRSALFAARADNVFLVKASFWIGR